MQQFTFKAVALSSFFMLLGTFPVSGQTAPWLRIPFREGKLWGHSDTLANIVFQPQYDSIGFYDINQSDYAIFKKNGKLGVIDFQYKQVIPAATDVLKFSNAINERGLITFLSYKDPNWGYPSQLWMASGNRGAVGVYEITSQLKIIKELIPPIYDDASFYYSGSGNILMAKAGKWCLYNKNGEKQCEPIYDEIFQSHRFPETRSMKKQGMVGRIGQDYYFIVPNGEAIKLKDGTQPGVPKEPFDVSYSTESQEVISKQKPAGKAKFGFQEILFEKSEGLLRPPQVLVQKNKKMAVWDSQKNELETGYYDDFFAVQRGTVEAITSTPSPKKQDKSILYFVRKGKRCGIVDDKGVVRTPFVYDGFGKITSSYYITQAKGKYGVTLNGTIYPAIQPGYDSISLIIQSRVTPDWMFGVFKVQKDGLPGFLGENGKEYFINK